MVYTNEKWEDPEDIAQQARDAAVGTTNYLYFLFHANIMPSRKPRSEEVADGKKEGVQREKAK